MNFLINFKTFFLFYFIVIIISYFILQSTEILENNNCGVGEYHNGTKCICIPEFKDISGKCQPRFGSCNKTSDCRHKFECFENFCKPDCGFNEKNGNDSCEFDCQETYHKKSCIPFVRCNPNKDCFGEQKCSSEGNCECFSGLPDENYYCPDLNIMTTNTTESMMTSSVETKTTDATEPMMTSSVETKTTDATEPMMTSSVETKTTDVTEPMMTSTVETNTTDTTKTITNNFYEFKFWSGSWGWAIIILIIIVIISIFIYIYKPWNRRKNQQSNQKQSVSSELSQFEKLNSPKNQSRENDYDIVDDNNNETNEPFLPSKESSGAARCRFYFGS
ncbi:uncharacterized protein LOC142597594 [Dermatophagoides farinae]|uniref:uncharacterized protein LOC142597594 n=1 Tax=Dermatophagoides farinae TaxID=6954 RepID=UPI003F613A77